MHQLLLAVALAGGSAHADRVIHRAGPIRTWDEGVPLGNGLVGGLLWGEEGVLRLSLDRGDLWDLRPAPGTDDKDFNYAAMKRLVAAGNQAELDRLFDGPYNHPYPTKIPAGRVEFRLPGRPESFDLNLDRATGTVNWAGGTVRALIADAILLDFQGLPVEPVLQPPKSVAKLGYELARVESTEGATWFTQKCAEGLEFTVYVARTKSLVAVKIGRRLAEARRGAEASLRKGWAATARDHEKWWSKFWAQSSVTIPDAKLQTHYDLVKYFYGAASRKGSPPMPLQGVWTADEGNLPPWKGDYHNDLNTQMTYLAYPTAGLWDSGLSWIEYNWRLLPTYKAFARSFYAVNGAVIPGVMTLDGKPLAGWGMYALSPTNGAWIAHQFDQHWRYTGDPNFLRNRAYPFCREIGTALAGLLRPDGTLPLSSSPEIHDNSLRAWLKPNSNYDGMLMQWLFGALADMTTELKLTQEANKWRALAARIPAWSRDPEDSGLAFSEGELYRDSHRHFSHALGLYPLNTLAPDTNMVSATLERMKKHGTAWWTGYSFAWFSAMLARCNRSDEALKQLQDYERAFILPNGFHVNGDQTKSGLSNFQYRPFTLEGNFIAMQAVHEMLIRSEGGVVTVFPAMPSQWRDASFRALRAHGGFIVDATRRDGTVTSIRVRATQDKVLRLTNPWPGHKVKWSRPVEHKGSLIEVRLKPGESISAR
ncbi:MAG: hypothetical protein JNJ45_05150 [Chthonomonas sp.]|nr:hypothetical protein [Chthonomonas sp.]